MRTIHVTGGRKDYAQMTLVDDLGGDLAPATIRMGVSASKTTQPADWFPPDLETYPSPGRAVLSLLLDSTRAPAGTWYLWADVVDNPTSQPVCATNEAIRTV